MVMTRADANELLASLGGVARAAGSFVLRWLTRPQRDELLASSGLAHRVVWSVPEDALAEGWTTQPREGSEAEREALDELDDRLKLECVLLEADGAARADGGAWLWVVLEGDRDFDEPLPDGPHQIAAVHVVTREEVHVQKRSLDLESSDYARPELMTVTMIRSGVSVPAETVHASRMIYIPGMRAIPGQQTNAQFDDYDLAALQVYLPAIQDLERAWSSGATLVERLSMPQLTIVDGASKAAKDELGWVDRLRVFTRSMTSKGLMVLLGSDRLQWVGPSVSGYGELTQAQAHRLSAPEGIPLSRLLGQAPAGLSTDDKSGARTYYDFIHRHRRTVLTPAILRLYEIEMGPGKRDVVWPTLDKPTRLEQAQISAQLAQRDATLIAAAVLSEEEVRSRFEAGEERTYPMLEERDLDAERAALLSELADEPQEPGAEPTPQRAPGAGAAEVDPREVLNGAQIQALVSLVQQVRAGELPREGAINIMVSGLGMTEERAGSFFAGIEKLGPVNTPSDGGQDGEPPPEDDAT